MFAYKTDFNNIIISVNTAFVDFARRNWDAGFTAETILGRDLLGYITCKDTAELYRMLISRMHALPRRLVYPFRCDSPEMRRFMKMTVTSDETGDIRWSSQVLRQEPRQPVGILMGPPEKAERLLTACSWCKRLQWPQWLPEDGPWNRRGEWVEVEALLPALGLREEARAPGISHGICPKCHGEVVALFTAA